MRWCVGMSTRPSWSCWLWRMHWKHPAPRTSSESSLTSLTASSARWGRGAPSSANYWPPCWPKPVREAPENSAAFSPPKRLRYHFAVDGNLRIEKTGLSIWLGVPWIPSCWFCRTDSHHHHGPSSEGNPGFLQLPSWQLESFPFPYPIHPRRGDAKWHRALKLRHVNVILRLKKKKKIFFLRHIHFL